MTSPQPQQRSDQRHDRAPRESVADAVLRCLDAASPGLVTYRMLHAVVGIEPQGAVNAVTNLRRRYGQPIQSHSGLGFSLAVKRRDEAVSSSLAALSISDAQVEFHDRKANGDRR